MVVSPEDKATLAKLEELDFQIISTVGTARGMFFEAIQLAKAGKIDEARAKIEQGNEIFNEGHNAHRNIFALQDEENALPFDLLLVHAEDQMMSAETFKMVALELIDLYEKLA